MRASTALIAMATVAVAVILVLAFIFIAEPRSRATVPSAPVGLIAHADNGQIHLRWETPFGDGGSAIIGYKIYRGTSPGAEGSDPITTATTRFYNDTGLTNHQTYYYRVSAVNSVGESPKSSEVNATPSIPVPPRHSVTVYFIDVGQGDSILIQTTDSKNILIDAGPESAATTVISFLQQHSVTTLTALIATHPDADHIGGADEVLQSFQVLSVYHSGFVKSTQTNTDFITAVDAEGCPVYTDAQIDPGDMLSLSSIATFQVLSIDANAPDSNSASIVLKMTYGTVDFIFEGDAPSSVESTMIANPSFSLDIEILKVSHHGSSSSTSDAWLTATSPDVGIISVGPNSYGHPTSETLARLSSHGVQAYRTDVDGTIAVTTDGTTWTVS